MRRITWHLLTWSIIILQYIQGLLRLVDRVKSNILVTHFATIKRSRFQQFGHDRKMKKLKIKGFNMSKDQIRGRKSKDLITIKRFDHDRKIWSRSWYKNRCWGSNDDRMIGSRSDDWKDYITIVGWVQSLTIEGFEYNWMIKWSTIEVSDHD